ncbi:uncharacterized protein LOC129907009 [Episyrphus balteatus]|uniref:uncharacterized protein LOC129907009 n=1 Tax=Episyrphus balteatus TaxID=286459 RepID=UPI002486482D|nr:uncharacterized protein LOC129907009 [Episyrphus balteatus]
MFQVAIKTPFFTSTMKSFVVEYPASKMSGMNEVNADPCDIERNLVLHIPSQENDEEVKLQAKNLCLDIMQSNDPERIARTKIIRSRDNRVANVIVELQNVEDVSNVLKSATKLRGTGISIHRDYTKAARDKRKQLLEIRKNISEKNKNIKVLTKGQTLHVDQRSYYFDSNNVLKCYDDVGNQLLQNLLSNVGVSCQTSGDDHLLQGFLAATRDGSSSSSL